MPHRATDTRLLAQVLKVDKEYSSSLNAVLLSSQTSLAALTAYASSCPPNHASAMMAVISTLSGAEEALKSYMTSVDAWRADLKRVRKCEEVVANVMRDREILIGKLIKVSHKRSTRDNVGLANQFVNEQSLGLLGSGTSTTSTSTLTAGGNVKLNHAQAELQACEAHLAEKEKELDEVRQDAIKKGLERRCKALVSCGWTWTERGKQALQALEAIGSQHSNQDTDKLVPNPRLSEHDDSQLSSLTPSQSASQIALVASDDSPSKSSQQRTGNQHFGHSGHPEDPLQPAPSSPQYALDIGPAHGINDQGNIHDSIPTGRPLQPKRTKSGESSDEEGALQKAPIVVVENKPFGTKSANTSTPARMISTRAPRENTGGRTLRRPPPHDSKAVDSPKIGFPVIGSPPHKAKHSSDLGPSTHMPPPQRSTFDDGYNRTRKRSTSFSIINGITGMFRGRKRSTSVERDYGTPLSTGGWHTRTDRNLVRSRVGGGRNSSSEEELPSTLVRKSKLAEQAAGGSDISGPTSKRLSKRHLPSITKSSKSVANDIQEGSKYTVIERSPRTELARNDSHSSKRSEKHSSESSRQVARETAANTALNASTNSTVTRRTSSPPERSKWEDTPQGSAILNRLHQGDGTRKLNVEPRSSELSEIAERLRRLEEMDTLLRRDDTRTSAVPASPPAKLEVVKAPPSITQVSSLYDAIPSTSYADESPSARRSSFRGAPSPIPEQVDSPPGRGHSRQKSIGGVADLKARASITSPSTPPLKSALKSPKITATQLSPPPAAIIHEMKPSTPDLSQPSRASVETPPTPLGAKDGLKVNGDSFFVSNAMLGNRPLSPPTSPSILVPIPRRLSEIPGSARESMISDDGDSAYETPYEDMSDEEKDEDLTPNQETPNGLMPVPLPATPPPPIEPLTMDRVKGVSQDDASSVQGQTQGADVSATASNSTRTSNSNSTQTRRKSVRMIIYPTAAVSPPDRYDDELPTPRAEAPSPSPPRAAAPLQSSEGKRSSGGMWRTRIDATRNAWEDSSEEDEEYGRAKRALARATEQPEGSGRRR